jgi:hypothetical protein
MSANADGHSSPIDRPRPVPYARAAQTDGSDNVKMEIEMGRRWKLQ